MSLSLSPRTLLPDRSTRILLVKWLVGLLVPVAVFTFAWSGEAIVNNAFLGLFAPSASRYDTTTALMAAIFILIFYATLMALAGYTVAADSGRRNIIEIWSNIFILVVVPLLLIIITNQLLIGLALCAVVVPLYYFVRNLIRKVLRAKPPVPLEDLQVLDAEKRITLMERAKAGGFWFGAVFALIWLIVDLIYYFIGTLPNVLLIWVVARTILFPVAGYFLGRIGGVAALRRALTPDSNGDGNGNASTDATGIARKQLEHLSVSRASEEARDIVPNDLPLQSSGAQRFYLTLLIAFALFYPILDPLLFGFGTNGRLSGYADAGYYIILALGLNIVVGFAGLLDLGYVAFFALGAYSWAMIGSTHFGRLTGVLVNPELWPWFFWPMLLGGALITAFWGVVLGAPTLRLRGDYLAIVSLGFGEIIPIFFYQLDAYTNGTNGIVGVFSPKLPCAEPWIPCIEWGSYTPVPYYYLILALIALCIFANVRLRDSRLGRAWIAIREDEIAAASSGINLARTKLFAFGAGAFFAGVAGVYRAAKLGTVTPDTFTAGDSIIYLAMVVIGGLGSIPGVIFGAFAVYAINLFILNQLDSLASDPSSFLFTIKQIFPGFTFGNIRNLLFGVILVAIMIFRPEGLIPSSRRRRELHHTDEDAVEVSSLDEPPGSQKFEAERRVE